MWERYFNRNLSGVCLIILQKGFENRKKEEEKDRSLSPLC